MRWLKDVFKIAEKGLEAPRMLIIKGESGIGKSKLVREFQIWAQLRSIKKVSGKADEGVGRLFGPFVPIIEKLVRIIEVKEFTNEIEKGLVLEYAGYIKNILPSITKGYEVTEPVKLEAAQEKTRLLDKISEFVIKGVEKDSLIIVIEDAQWFDEMSLWLEGLASWGGMEKRCV